MKYGLLLILCTVLAPVLWTQKDTPLFHHVDKLVYKSSVSRDSSFSIDSLNAIEMFKLAGYIGLEFDSTVHKKNGAHAYYTYRHKFDRIETRCMNCKRNGDDVQKTYGDVAKLLNRQIDDLANNGFPFAGIKVVNEIESGDTLKLDYVIDSGKYFIIDKIHIKSEDKIHPKTFLSLINLKTGDEYSEAQIKEITQTVEYSKHFELKQPPQVLFKPGKAELFLFVSKRKSSNADGFVGFNQDPDSKKLVFNGNIDLSLHNALNRAEGLDISWKSNPDKTQNLYGQLQYPWILGSPLGAGSRINLRKQDSTFIKSDIWLEASYLHPWFTVTMFDQIEGSATLRKTAPPGIRDYKKNTVGLRVNIRPRLPDLLKFYKPELTITGGIYQYRSDTLDDNKQKIGNNKYAIGYGHSIRFLRMFQLKNNLEFQGLQSSISLSDNELVYYGGLRSVRGFYELELFGNNVWILNSEIEFQPVSVLSMSLIYDYSIADISIGKNYTNSLGIGFGLVSRSSRLEIVVANGMLNDNPIDFSNTRIHIGFRSNF